jgi:hypothetical protein
LLEICFFFASSFLVGPSSLHPSILPSFLPSFLSFPASSSPRCCLPGVLKSSNRAALCMHAKVSGCFVRFVRGLDFRVKHKPPSAVDPLHLDSPGPFVWPYLIIIST